MWSIFHVMAIKVNIAKNGNIENLTRCDIIYIFRTYFYVDLESEVRMSIFYLGPVL
jgi:hypothetical protein